MRRLSSRELYDGIYVQCNETIYQILIKENKHFYREINSKWEMPGDIVKDIWMETEETKSLNRDFKINNILND